MDKPLLVYDGDCGFCRAWVVRWIRMVRHKIDHAPYQEVANRFKDVPLTDFQRAVQFIEPDGHRTSGAKAVFRTLEVAGSPGWLRVYKKVPGFAAFTEFAYSVIAGHRPMF